MSEPSSLPRPLVDFVRLVDEGGYWESHEVLEGPWREGGSEFYHGLILYASAFVHVERDNAHGIRAQLEKALAALEPYPEAYLGVDVAALRTHARATLDAIAGADGEPAEGWWAVVERPRVELDPAWVRGDEEELG